MVMHTLDGDDPAARAAKPRYGSDDERRRQLIAVAEAVFLEKGFHAATMDDIARRAGMSKKTIYQIFPGKTALFDVLLTERLSPLFVPIENDGRPPAEILIDFLDRVARIVLSAEQIALTRLMVAESQRSPEIGQAFERQGIGRGNSALERWLAARKADGSLAIESAEEASAMLFGMTICEFVLSRLVNKRAPPTEDEVRRRIRDGVTIFLAGVFKQD